MFHKYKTSRDQTFTRGRVEIKLLKLKTDFMSVLIFCSYEEHPAYLTFHNKSLVQFRLSSSQCSRVMSVSSLTCVFVFQMKKELGDNDSISQEVVGNAHIENYALKMFLYADNEDRAGRFHK